MEKKEVFSYTLEDKFSMEDLEARRLYLTAVINEDTTGTIIYHILRYNRIDHGIPVEASQLLYISILQVEVLLMDLVLLM